MVNLNLFRRKADPASLPEKLQRSGDYRRSFLKKHRGYLWLGIYSCTYCGRLLTAKRVTVDHIVAVDRMRWYSKRRRAGWLKKDGGINDVSNLVGACATCNSRKGSKGGFWIARAKVGRLFYPVFWTAMFGFSPYIVGMAYYVIKEVAVYVS